MGDLGGDLNHPARVYKKCVEVLVYARTMDTFIPDFTARMLRCIRSDRLINRIASYISSLGYTFHAESPESAVYHIRGIDQLKVLSFTRTLMARYGCHLPYLEYRDLCLRVDIPEVFVREMVDTLHWFEIFSEWPETRRLTDFAKRYMSDDKWDALPIEVFDKMTPAFIREFHEKLDFHNLLEYGLLDDELQSEFQYKLECPRTYRSYC